MSITTKSLFLAAILSAAHGFQLTFYAGQVCRGARQGGRELFLADGCVNGAPYSGISTSVQIRPTTEESDRTVVLYEDENCALETAIATGNIGCLATQNFRSMNVIGGSGRNKREVDSAAETAPSDLVPAVSNEVQDEVVGSLGIMHGDFFEHDGDVWRWQQLAPDTYTGVRAAEWANTMRIANFEPLVYNDNFPFNFAEWDATHDAIQTDGEAILWERSGMSPNNALDLERRQNFLQPFCRAIQNCFWAVGLQADYYFPRQTEAVVNQIEAVRQRSTFENIWRFLMNPYVSGFGAGAVTGRYYSNNAPESSCSATEDTAVLRALIDTGIVGQDQVNAVRRLVQNGNTNQEGALAVSITPPGEYNTGHCGAPASDPTPTFLGRVKRSSLMDIPGYQEFAARYPNRPFFTF